LNSSITVGIVNLGSLNVFNTSISTTNFAAISQGNIYLNESHIDTTARGCRTNMGSGRGLVVQNQNSFCSSGSAGAGYGLKSDPSCSSIMMYFMFLVHSFPYMSKGPSLSSGSGGYGYSNAQNSTKGSGGGIVYIFAK